MKFSQANSKLKKLYSVQSLQKYLCNRRKVYSFDLPAGWTCPAAKLCLSKAIDVNGNLRIEDGKDTEFRCYAASQEVLFKNVHTLRNYNFNILKAAQKTNKCITTLILNSLPKNCGIVRMHSSGDFYNQYYFNAWVGVAKIRPDILFYGYTKNAIQWLPITKLPDNFALTASYGGTYDSYITNFNLKSAVVVYSTDEAKQANLEIDEDDSHAADVTKGSFALLIHGVGPKGSKHAKAVQSIKKKI